MRNSPQSVHLYGWLIRVEILKVSFHDISFKHIYREFNYEGDHLSKISIKEITGFLRFAEFVNGVLIDSSCYAFI